VDNCPPFLFFAGGEAAVTSKRTSLSRKDYYKILQVQPGSTHEEVRKSYRKLALKYHPDKNPENAYAGAHFREINEAYEVLSHPTRRFEYDCKNGVVNKKSNRPVTPQNILNEAARLRRYVHSVNSASLNQEALEYHLMRLLSDANIELLKQSNHVSLNKQVVFDLIETSRFLKHNYLALVIDQLRTLAESDIESASKLQSYSSERQRQYLYEKYMPLGVLTLTVILCLLIYSLST
jgi:molecular chaperone DnaJ